MTRSFFKITTLFLLATFMGMGCEKNPKPEFSGYAEGYITGSFICDKVDRKTGVATGERTQRGYCIILENSEKIDSHWPMDYYTFDIPSGLFNFPKEILLPGYNGSDCGPLFFPAEQKLRYKIRFRYRKSTGDEKVGFTCGPCTFMDLTFRWDKVEQMTLKGVEKLW